MTSQGAPSIYYGGEAGMWGADDPDERKPMLWADMVYDDEVSHPFGKERPADKNIFNADLFEWYKALIGIRRSHKALSLGSTRAVLLDDRHDVYAWVRSFMGEEVLMVINNGREEQSIPLSDVTPAIPGNQWKVLIAADDSAASGDGNTLILAPKSGMIFQRGQGDTR
jgi:glycosidase